MRRLNFLPIFLLALGLSIPAVGQSNRWNDDNDWWDDDNWGRGSWTSEFDRLDRNDNGYISQNEWTGNDRVFERADRNNDNRLSRSEVRRWENDRMERLEDRFREADDNRDRRLSAREWWGRDLAFERLDVNGDHYLSWREVRDRDDRDGRDGRYGRYDRDDRYGRDDRAFNNLDRNRDGRINRDEWSGNRLDFDRLDRNNDGWVTVGEWSRS